MAAAAGGAPVREARPRPVCRLRTCGSGEPDRHPGAAGARHRPDHPLPKPLSDSVLRAADVIITMGCGDSCPIFPGKRYEDWDVADPAGQPVETVREDP